MRLPNAENRLIELLPRKSRQRLLGLAEQFELKPSEVLGDVRKPTRYVYFPTDGYISLITTMDGRPALEVGMVGREGMFGAQIALGVVTQSLHALVQGPGAAWRIPMSQFRTELARDATLHKIVNRYVYVLMEQLALAAACVRFHEISPRLSRWLLMMIDRAHSDSFQVTHEFLGFMLGVRRVGITKAASALQERHFIEYRRGAVHVLNRKGLEGAACSCYAADLQAYARLIK